VACNPKLISLLLDKIQLMTIQPFHLAFPVHDLAAAREFYGKVMGCEEGRSSPHWIDFNFFGHQIVTHLVEAKRNKASSDVDGHNVPVPHFGVVLTMAQFDALVARLRSHNVKFELEPVIRFKGMVGEQATMFFLDPSGNALEFKAFEDQSQLFAK
jgi:extradiol dioxygenase family protein